MEQTEIAKTFGKVLRQLRKEAKLTQEQLAFEADIQRVYVSILELGQQQPSLNTILKLAKGLRCPASLLVTLTEEQLEWQERDQQD